jgi:hypothetical protein
MEASMNRVRVVGAGFLGAAGLVLIVAATAPAQEAPKPGPEHKRLEYYVGEWTAEVEVKANPFMPAGKYGSEDECEWFEGGFAVICESEGTGPLGKMESVAIMGYNAEEKVYTYYGVDNTGMVPASVAKGSVQGDTWTYTDESKMGGKLVKSRYTLQHVSPSSYTFKWEVEGEGGKWATLMEGKTTKKK